MATYFPDQLWIGLEVSFPNDPRRWTLLEKRVDQSETQTEAEASLSNKISWGGAEFLAECKGRPDCKAIVKVHIQIPLKGTELLPPSMRAVQARSDKPSLPSGPFEALEAWKRVSTISPPVTGVLLYHFENLQGPEGLVPGGWSMYMLISEPRGEPLGTGVNVARGDHFCPEGKFWDLDLSTRDVIRAQSEAIYNLLASAGVAPFRLSLRSLYWDEAARKLYFSGRFLPTGPPFPYRSYSFGPREFASWGLAKSPYNSKADKKLFEKKENDATMQELEAAGWIF